VTVRPVGPEPGDLTEDQPGVGGGEHVVAETEPLQIAGPGPLDDDVALPGQVEEGGLALVVAQVEPHALLPPVPPQVHEGGTAGPADSERAAGPHRIAERTGLHLDDLGAEVGEMTASRGRRQLRHLEYPDSAQ
jgi:hypothetical protein